MKQKEILMIIISAFILVVFWIGFNIYHGTITSTVPQSVNEQIAPINPNFDDKIIEKLKKRVRIQPLLKLENNNISSGSSTRITPTPSFNTNNNSISSSSGGF